MTVERTSNACAAVACYALSCRTVRSGTFVSAVILTPRPSTLKRRPGRFFRWIAAVFPVLQACRRRLPPRFRASASVACVRPSADRCQACRPDAPPDIEHLFAQGDLPLGGHCERDGHGSNSIELYPQSVRQFCLISIDAHTERPDPASAVGSRNLPAPSPSLTPIPAGDST